MVKLGIIYQFQKNKRGFGTSRTHVSVPADFTSRWLSFPSNNRGKRGIPVNQWEVKSARTETWVLEVQKNPLFY